MCNIANSLLNPVKSFPHYLVLLSKTASLLAGQGLSSPVQPFHSITMSRLALLILCAISIILGCRAAADGSHPGTETDATSNAVNKDRARIGAHWRSLEISHPGKITKRSPNIKPFNDTTTCTGQTISAIDLITLNITGCDQISLTYGVATGDLQAAMGNPLCAVRAPSYCVLAPCKLERTSAGNTW